MCWLQAALQAANPPVVTEADLAGVTHHQLAFAGTTKMCGPRSGARRRAPRQPPTASPSSTGVSRCADGGQLQLHLPGPGRAFGWAAHAEPANPALVRMRQMAQVMSQAQGWNTTLVAELDRALVILLSGHADDQPLRYTQLVDVLHRYGVSITRVAEVLSRGGLLDDDRVPASGSWLQDKLADLAPGIAADVHAWIRALQHGGPRSHPATPAPCAAVCAPSIRCSSNGRPATSTCAKSPPATSPRSPTPCTVIPAGTRWARCDH
ncbi:MAG: hypothetical protein ACRDRE_03770 [Pseudonocardiaceae bacterium]